MGVLGVPIPRKQSSPQVHITSGLGICAAVRVSGALVLFEFPALGNPEPRQGALRIPCIKP